MTEPKHPISDSILWWMLLAMLGLD